MLMPLYGGGFTVAWIQIAVFYYTSGILLHYVAPALLPVKNIQVQPRGSGDIGRDALGSLGTRGWWLRHACGVV
jgi:Delta7-sterol 5-desaturase